MTSMERVVAALQGTEADRRAFTMTLSLYGAKLTGCPLSEYYTSPDRYLQGQIAVYDHCRPDILFTPFAFAPEAQAFGSEIFYLQKNPPNVRKPFIRDPKDIDKITVPDIGSDEGLQYLLSSARLLADHFKGAVPICGVLASPLDLPAVIMGVGNWLEILLFDDEKASAVISLMSEYFVTMANSMFDNGINFLAIPMMFSNPRLVFEKTVKETVVPALADIFSRLKGPVVFHHGGNPLAGFLPLYRNIPNIAGFALDQHDDFSEARKNIGENMLLLGNLEGPTLGLVTTAHALERAQKILDNRRDDRHFIFATSGADVAWDTPMETITGIYDLIQHYGAGHA
ncbi:MAG: uroporphyrinogen decarboxylase family protein [Desulfuromonadaceae bacterium]|nr:uroporphyrinogen decarboxylase family protein [Desulfuromonadaceae bacterium]MDD5105548.1 uroporphyrinogen decarboxylase family protein [Desulfuromonadaceae bacterium]